MVNWFASRRRARVDAPRVHSRSTSTVASTKVDLTELTPSIAVYLGKAAYLQLMIFENLSRAVATAPTTAAKESLSRAAALSLAKHQGLVREIEIHGENVAEVMEIAARPIDRFQDVTRGSDWTESLISCYVVAGFLDDFFYQLAGGLSPTVAARIRGTLGAESGEKLIAAELERAIAANPRLAARLALWGRRLVGDTLLIARSSLVQSANHDSDEARIEPIFSELIAGHTRRMDALGLTA